MGRKENISSCLTIVYSSMQLEQDNVTSITYAMKAAPANLTNLTAVHVGVDDGAATR
jgi:hypothetical protein